MKRNKKNENCQTWNIEMLWHWKTPKSKIEARETGVRRRKTLKQNIQYMHDIQVISGSYEIALVYTLIKIVVRSIYSNLSLDMCYLYSITQNVLILLICLPKTKSK